MQAKYDPAKLKDGFNTVSGEESFSFPIPLGIMVVERAV